MAIDDKKTDAPEADKTMDNVDCASPEEEPVTDDKPADESILDATTTEDAPLVKKEPEPPKSPVHKQDFEEGLVYFYCTPRSAVVPSVSPFCLKVESWLRVATVKYEVVEHNMKLRSRKGQLPFVEVNGEEIADSAAIIKELSLRNDADLDAGLTSQQRGIASCATAMLENHFFWVVKAWRSKNPDQMLSAYKMDLQQITGKTWPKPILNFLYKRQAKKDIKAVLAQGLGVHSAEEIDILGQEDLQALTELLGNQEYFFGDSPTTLDIVTFANLAQVLYMDAETKCPLKDWLTENCPKLVEFCQRFKDKVFPDWDTVCTTKKEEPKENKSDDKTEEEKPDNKEHKSEKEQEDENIVKSEKNEIELNGGDEKKDDEKEKKDIEKEDKNTSL